MKVRKFGACAAAFVLATSVATTAALSLTGAAGATAVAKPPTAACVQATLTSKGCTIKVSPSSKLVNDNTVSITGTNWPDPLTAAGGPYVVAVTECSIEAAPTVANPSGDPAGCNENFADIGNPGGPELAYVPGSTPTDPVTVADPAKALGGNLSLTYTVGTGIIGSDGSTCGTGKTDASCLLAVAYVDPSTIGPGDTPSYVLDTLGKIGFTAPASVKASQASKLVGGDTVTVGGAGYPANAAGIVLLECDGNIPADLAAVEAGANPSTVEGDCDLNTVTPAPVDTTPGTSGAFSGVSMQLAQGLVGPDATNPLDYCGAGPFGVKANTSCYLVAAAIDSSDNALAFAIQKLSFVAPKITLSQASNLPQSTTTGDPITVTGVGFPYAAAEASPPLVAGTECTQQVIADETAGGGLAALSSDCLIDPSKANLAISPDSTGAFSYGTNVYSGTIGTNTNSGVLNTCGTTNGSKTLGTSSDAKNCLYAVAAVDPTTYQPIAFSFVTLGFLVPKGT
jgi:hypothetical protein